MHPKSHLDVSTVHGQVKRTRCNKDGQCVFGFPFALRDSTTVNEDRRVLYRQDTPEDAWVVSYMPALTKLMECHVNVDVCFTVNIFMYLYKYLFKGPDRSKFALTWGQPKTDDDEVNEFDDYIAGRYLSATEAAWRILAFDITRKSPAVVSIPIHLPDRNFGQMRRGVTYKDSLSSKLLRYFARPRTEEFRSLLILNYYHRYRLETLNPGIPLRSGEFWEQPDPRFVRCRVIRRVGAPVVTQLISVSPRSGELFYLRALLLHRPAYSFSDLRSVHGTEYPTFHQAATALGLFDNETEAEQALGEAVDSYCSPAQLRFLFSQILLNVPASAVELFRSFQEQLSADYIDQSYSADRVLALTL